MHATFTARINIYSCISILVKESIYIQYIWLGILQMCFICTCLFSVFCSENLLFLKKYIFQCHKSSCTLLRFLSYIYWRVCRSENLILFRHRILFLNVGYENIDSKLDFTAWVTDSFSLPSQERINTFQDTLSPSGGF